MAKRKEQPVKVIWITPPDWDKISRVTEKYLAKLISDGRLTLEDLKS